MDRCEQVTESLSRPSAPEQRRCSLWGTHPGVPNRRAPAHTSVKVTLKPSQAAVTLTVLSSAAQTRYEKHVEWIEDVGRRKSLNETSPLPASHLPSSVFLHGLHHSFGTGLIRSGRALFFETVFPLFLFFRSMPCAEWRDEQHGTFKPFRSFLRLFPHFHSYLCYTHKK